MGFSRGEQVVHAEKGRGWVAAEYPASSECLVKYESGVVSIDPISVLKSTLESLQAPSVEQLEAEIAEHKNKLKSMADYSYLYLEEFRGFSVYIGHSPFDGILISVWNENVSHRRVIKLSEETPVDLQKQILAHAAASIIRMLLLEAYS